METIKFGGDYFLIPVEKYNFILFSARLFVSLAPNSNDYG